MILSVLRNPLKNNDFMLLDTSTTPDTVIDTGNIDTMYRLKDELEKEERRTSNEKWMADIFKKRLAIVSQLLSNKEQAERLLQIKMPAYHAAWLKSREAL